MGFFLETLKQEKKKREKGEKPNTESVLTVKYDFYGKIKLQDVTIPSGSLVHGWIIKFFCVNSKENEKKGLYVAFVNT